MEAKSFSEHELKDDHAIDFHCAFTKLHFVNKTIGWLTVVGGPGKLYQPPGKQNQVRYACKSLVPTYDIISLLSVLIL